jgi:DNA-directed RNA polymerase specialized sigma24 family protein
MDLEQEFRNRISKIHGLDGSTSNVQIRPDPTFDDIRHAEFQAMADVFLGADFDPVKLKQVEDLQVALHQRQAELAQVREKLTMSDEEYLFGLKSSIEETFRLFEGILGTEAFCKLFGGPSQASSGLIDEAKFLKKTDSTPLAKTIVDLKPVGGSSLEATKRTTQVTVDFPWKGNGSSLSRFVVAAADGNQEAMGRLWKHYSIAMLEVARSRLIGSVKRTVDEEDIALSAFRSFCSLVGRHDVQIQNRKNLWALLVTLTVRKVHNATAYAMSAKRDVRKEVSLDGIVAQIPSKEPTAEFVASFQEEFDHLMNILDNDDLRAIARHKLSGLTNEEIALEMQITRRTVERKLMLVRSLWNEDRQE